MKKEYHYNIITLVFTDVTECLLWILIIVHILPFVAFIFTKADSVLFTIGVVWLSWTPADNGQRFCSCGQVPSPVTVIQTSGDGGSTASPSFLTDRN